MGSQKGSSGVLLLAVVAALYGNGALRAAEPPGAATTVPAGSARQEALRWLDRFRADQVLFHEQDLDRIRAKLAEATPEQARQWLDQTREIRQMLDDRTWQATRRWLKEFLKVQAIYSDQQVEQFRKRAQEAVQQSPEALQGILAEVEQKRATLAGKSADSARRRQQVLAINQAYKQEQFAQREAARREAQQAARSAPSRSTPVPAKPAPRVTPPLVSSLDVARGAVIRGIYPRW